MNPRFDHLLITRFNVRVRNDKSASNDWLRHRLRYFTNVCCPSVRSQTTQDFKWIVLFDADRELWFEEEIRTLSTAGKFQPVWVHGKFTREMVAVVAEQNSSAEWLITSRLDNDDAIARDYIASVQLQFAEQAMEFINFQNGLQLSDSGRVLHRLDPSSPFIALIEKRTHHPPVTVYGWQHHEVGQHAPVRQVKSHPMWLQVIHEKNMANRPRGIRADPRLLHQCFDVDVATKAISRPALLVDKVATTLSLSWRVLQKPSRISWLGKVIWSRLRPSSSVRDLPAR